MTSSVFSHEEALPCRRIGGGRDPLPGVGRAAGLAAVAILSLAWAGPAAADERLIRDYLVDEVRQWSSSPVVRSEEHTSELQSLMRISYAVFCLKKKTQTNTQNTHKTIE